MNAVIATGGKQYHVAEGQKLKVEKLSYDVGATFDFEQVLMVALDNQISIGQPLVSGAKVSAEVISHGRHKKIKIIKFRRRKHHMKKMGHRQDYTEIKITGIKAA